jgi:cell division protease FtsH
MSFPSPARQGADVPTVARTVLFWLLMIFLAVVLWRMSTSSSHGTPASPVSYSDFMAQVDGNNIRTAKLSLAQNTAAVSGELRAPAGQRYATTVPRDTVSRLTDTLRKQSVSVEIAEAQRSGPLNLFTTFGPIILLIGFWIFMMKQVQSKKTTNQPGHAPGSGPL